MVLRGAGSDRLGDHARGVHERARDTVSATWIVIAWPGARVAGSGQRAGAGARARPARRYEISIVVIGAGCAGDDDAESFRRRAQVGDRDVAALPTVVVVGNTVVTEASGAAWRRMADVGANATAAASLPSEFRDQTSPPRRTRCCCRRREHRGVIAGARRDRLALAAPGGRHRQIASAPVRFDVNDHVGCRSAP